jgi:pyruvate/2-oxoglutarate dehydrogenase complex dihydrolipoamide acyltransferase (E2) component
MVRTLLAWDGVLCSRLCQCLLGPRARSGNQARRCPSLFPLFPPTDDDFGFPDLPEDDEGSEGENARSPNVATPPLRRNRPEGDGVAPAQRSSLRRSISAVVQNSALRHLGFGESSLLEESDTDSSAAASQAGSPATSPQHTVATPPVGHAASAQPSHTAPEAEIPRAISRHASPSASPLAGRAEMQRSASVPDGAVPGQRVSSPQDSAAGSPDQQTTVVCRIPSA